MGRRNKHSRKVVKGRQGEPIPGGGLSGPRAGVTDLVVAERLNELEALIVRGHSPREVGATLTARWGVGLRTVQEYTARVTARWLDEEVEARPARRAVFRARLNEHYTAARDAGEWGAATKTLDLIGKLDGLSEPTEIRATVRQEVALTTADERRILDELLEERRQILEVEAVEVAPRGELVASE